MQPPQSRSSYPLIENDTYHTDGKPHIICCSVLGKLMSNFHLEMICNRTSCMYDIVKFMVDHWIRIKLLFFFLSRHMSSFSFEAKPRPLSPAKACTRKALPPLKKSVGEKYGKVCGEI